MKYLDLTLPTPEENLAADEALLELCESGGEDEVLRFWESSQPFVVLGYSNRAAVEVYLDAARRAGVPVLRRCTGGGAVVQGPGCLNYTLVLRIEKAAQLGGVAETNRYILQRHRDALAPLLGGTVAVRGISDLATGELKISGNAQRRKKHCVLFHGTFLLDFDIELVERLLPLPSREPDYRRRRPHREFLTNAALLRPVVKSALARTWRAGEVLTSFPMDLVQRLARERYGTEQWTYKF
ncbi:MAG: lipoate--protein ligase family protein [Verrucomicrobiae bacterium]|nr:lipoate--protein ligase family protein [Verrucomicrobiae bacterium]